MSQPTAPTPAPAAPPTPSAPARSRGHIVAVFCGLLLAMFVSSLSETIAATALPTIVGDLGGVEIMQWVSTTYILTSTVSMPVYGKLSDSLGRKRLLIVGLVIYAAGKVLCGVAPTMALMLAGRAVSGFGGGGLIILSQAAVADLVPADRRGTYLGIMGSIFTVSNVLGPLMGGWFVEVTGWRGIFWFTVPFALAAAAALAFLMHEPERREKARLDWVGTVCSTLAVTSLVLALSWGGDTFAWTSWQIVGLFALALAAAVAFVVAEGRVADPLIPLALFKNRNFNLCAVAGLLMNAAFIGAINYLPTFFQIVDRLSPELAGLLMAPMSIAVFGTSTLSGWIASHTSHYKWMLLVMCAGSAVGFWLMGTVDATTPVALIVAFTAVLGLALGMGFQILVLIVQNEFPHAMVGTATADNNFFRQIGATVGTSVFGTLFTTGLVTNLADKVPAGMHLDVATLTPTLVDKMPAALQAVVAEGYADSLVPLFRYFVPIACACLVLMAFIREHRLATSIDNRGTAAAADGEGPRAA